MIVTLRTPIGDIVAKQPRASAVFEQHQIDYCCDGDQPLQLACSRAMTDPALVLQQIHRAAAEALDERDWTGASLTELSEHIVSVHHSFLRRALSASAAWFLDAETDGSLAVETGRGLLARLAAFREGIEPHLRLEERVIFPAIVRREQERLERVTLSRHAGAALPPEVADLVSEHRLIDTSLRQLSRDAGRAFAEEGGRAGVVAELAALEADVHRHLHLENNILFPRALALEAAYA